QNLKDVGITMKIETLEAAAVLANQQSGNFEVSSGNRPGRPDPILDVTEQTCAGGQKPYSGLCDNDFDALVAREDQETDFAKRKALLRQVNERFILNAATIGFGYFPATVAHRPTVKNFFNPRNLVIRDLQFTWLDK